MADSEEVITNIAGGKQSKLYEAFHLVDPYALQILASVHHRGAVKYERDNWRKIPTEEHLNHTMHHITEFMKERYTLVRDPNEDHLAHALCRLTFAVAMEVQYNGDVHTEHSDPKYHEPKTPSDKPNHLRDHAGRFAAVHPTTGFDEAARSFAAFASKARWHDLERASKTLGSKKAGASKPAVYRSGGRRR
jgi:hypothetical protein